MPKCKGSSIVEYVIPLALVAIVVGLGLFYIFTSGNLGKFFAKSGNMKIDQATGNMHQPLAKEDNIVSIRPRPNLVERDAFSSGNIDCVGDNCTIDMGNYVLEGIPADFNDFIQSTGSAGGVDKLSALIDQIATSNEIKDPELLQLVKKLANEGHNIGTELKKIENLSTGNVTKENREDYFYAFEESVYEILRQGNDPGLSLTFQNTLKELNEKYKSTSISEKAMGTINELSNEITSITTSYSADARSLRELLDDTSDYEAMEEYMDKLRPGSKKTHTNSTGICNEGGYTDTGERCN